MAPGHGDGSALWRLLPVCLFFSGLSSLILEVAWSRSLSLVLGYSYQAVATVVASMMTGLFLGSLIASRRLHHSAPKLARAYGVVEMGIGCFAALTPLMFSALPLLLAPLYAAPPPIFGTLRFLMVFTMLLPASGGMGVTLPLATAALAGLRPAGITADGTRNSSLGGKLYGLNTLGAFVGTLAGGFLLLPLLGLLRTTLLAAATSFTVGAAAWLLSRMARDRAGVAQAPVAAPAGGPARGALWILPLYAVSGCLAMIFEITWTRALGPVVGTSVYSFTMILGAILAGIGAGSLVLSHRGLQKMDPAWGFAVGEMMLSLFAFLSTWGLKYFPELLLRALISSAASPVDVLGREFLLFGFIVLPPALLLGGLFPFAARLAERLDPAEGAAVGRTYAWNTAGGIAGSLAAGFYLVGALGSERTLVFASAASALVALAALRLASGRRIRWFTGVVAAGMAAAFPFLVPSWDLYLMTSGVTRTIQRILREGGASGDLLAKARPATAQVPFHREGRSSTVTVVWDKGYTILRVDGKADASNLPLDMLTQVLTGHLPFFFTAPLSDVCVIGYGSGVTSHAVLTHPVRLVDTIEIERQVIEASPYFEMVNFRPLSDSRSRLILDDARTSLSYRPRKYDVIISEPSNPWMAGVNNLFTSEFYALVRRRLKPGGIFCQWVQSYEISGRNLGVILDTVALSFPHAHLFSLQMGADLVILASDRPLTLVPGAVELFPDQPLVAEDLGRVGIYSLADLVLRYTAPLPVPKPGGLLNTDDNSIIQYRAPLDLIRLDDSPSPLKQLGASHAAMMALFYPGRGEGEVLTELAGAAHRLGDKVTVEAIAAQLGKKGYAAQARQASELARTTVPPAAGPGAAGYLGAAEARIRAGDVAGATTALERAEAQGLRGAEENSRAGYVWLKARRFAEAEKLFDTAASDVSSPLRYRSLAGRGAARYGLGRRSEGLADIAAAKALKPGDPLPYLLLGWAYLDAGEKELARAELQEGLRKAPGDERLERAISGLPAR